MKRGRVIFAFLLTLVLWQLAFAQGAAFVLRWMDNPAEYEAPRTGYRIYRGVLPGQTNLVLVDSIPNNSVKDTSAVPGIRYYYATTALYANGMESEKSNEVTGMLMVGGGCNK